MWQRIEAHPTLHKGAPDDEVKQILIESFSPMLVNVTSRSQAKKFFEGYIKDNSILESLLAMFDERGEVKLRAQQDLAIGYHRNKQEQSGFPMKDSNPDSDSERDEMVFEFGLDSGNPVGS